ncbi:hypothetical protein [Streptomyces sp. JJ36]|uniref:hypothetical protein n=1 Tax=Streptomyces sp. JJ36 TaxID=2736645 RepID=UPI001F43AFD1|nr:hypothetical protein [Streptomyces sp. JJ36]MCF6525016.1 hypothetical protein [Streptomyces sp. JJ36]
MGEQERHTLTDVEEAFLVNAYEADILPGVRGDVDDDRCRSICELAWTLLALVDRGWIEVRRLEPWTSPSGESGYQPGAVVPRELLPAVLGDAGAWEYPDGDCWVGALTLVPTEAGRKVTHRSAEEEAE